MAYKYSRVSSISERGLDWQDIEGAEQVNEETEMSEVISHKYWIASERNSPEFFKWIISSLPGMLARSLVRLLGCLDGETLSTMFINMVVYAIINMDLVFLLRNELC